MVNDEEMARVRIVGTKNAIGHDIKRLSMILEISVIDADNYRLRFRNRRYLKND